MNTSSSFFFFVGGGGGAFESTGFASQESIALLYWLLAREAFDSQSGLPEDILGIAGLLKRYILSI